MELDETISPIRRSSRIKHKLNLTAEQPVSTKKLKKGNDRLVNEFLDPS